MEEEKTRIWRRTSGLKRSYLEMFVGTLKRRMEKIPGLVVILEQSLVGIFTLLVEPDSLICNGFGKSFHATNSLFVSVH